MITSKINVLVLGIGNLLMSDDGLGVHVLNELQQENWQPGVVLLEVGTALINYFQEISQAQTVIAVDAITAKEQPGTIYHLHLADLASLGTKMDAHGYSLLDIIAVAREMTGFPTEVVICGIEPKDCSFGSILSPEVRKNLPKLIDKVKMLISKKADV